MEDPLAGGVSRGAEMWATKVVARRPLAFALAPAFVRAIAVVPRPRRAFPAACQHLPSGVSEVTRMGRSVFTADDMLRYTEIPGFPNVYVIGCLESRVSIYSQQVRALNVIWALAEAKQLTSHRGGLAIIGAGFAGTTAALGASRLGWNVTVLERAHGAIHLQTDCRSRWIHPRIYDWPDSSWSVADAKLPVMSWHAGRVEQVVAGLQQQFKTATGAGVVDFRHSVTVTQLNALPSQVELSWTSTDPKTRTLPMNAASFDAVLVAVGFGIEDDHSASYWGNDNLERPSADGSISNWVVSGLGDGALIDVLRLRLGRGGSNITEFTEWLVDAWLPLVPQGMQEQLIALEREAQNSVQLGEDAVASLLHEGYRRILQSHPPNALTVMAKRLRPDTHVLFVGPREHPYERASVLHRVLIASLLSIDGDGTKWRRGRVEKAGADIEIVDGTLRETVAGREHCPRHGPKRDRLDHIFPQVHAALWDEKRKVPLLTGFDAPRTPLWPDDFFTEAVPRSVGTTRTLFLADSQDIVRRALQTHRFTWRSRWSSVLGFGVHLTPTAERAIALANAAGLVDSTDPKGPAVICVILDEAKGDVIRGAISLAGEVFHEVICVTNETGIVEFIPDIGEPS